MSFSRIWTRLILSIPLAAVLAYSTKADEIVELNIQETNVLNGTGLNTGIPLTFSTGHEVLSIAIFWVNTGTANFPFPNVFGAEDNIVLGGKLVNSVCNYLGQTGPSSFAAVDCTTPTLQAPFVSSVTYSGNWGSAEIGFAGNVPITIESTFSERTITPEPSVLALLAAGILSAFVFSMRPNLRGSTER